MSPDLQALFAQHKTAVLGAAGVGVVGLALYQRKKTGAGASTAAAAVPAATVTANPQPGLSSAPYDSSAQDVYNALEPQLEQIAQTTGQSGPLSVPKPVASTLFAPTYDGQYVHVGSGMGELESDGSVFVMNGDQWGKAAAAGPGNYTVTDLGSTVPAGLHLYSTGQNVLSAPGNQQTSGS